MGKGPTLFKFDAFSKTLDDRKIKTSSGGILTIICIVTTFLLLVNEYKDYNRIVLRPELVVDRNRGEKLDINVDVTFPHMPCDLISMDVMDLTGDIEVDLLKSGFVKTRLDPEGNEIEHQDFDANKQAGENKGLMNEQGYCGPCYGALNQDGNAEKSDEEKICCNTCESVKMAYAGVGWKFYDGKDVEQCEREGYVERINARLNEGCRIKGIAEINKIGGNLHFAPGASITIDDKHVHDMSLFDKHQDKFSFDHIINHFSFGVDDHQHESYFENDSHDHTTTHPLDGLRKDAANKYQLYSYFVKVVNTRFEYIDGQKIDTNEFSATQHDRPLRGGRDDDHPNTIHARGGLPGVFFYFDISPLKIINREEYNKSLSAFILSACSAIAGILTVGAILDRTIWTAKKFLKEKKDT